MQRRNTHGNAAEPTESSNLTLLEFTCPHCGSHRLEEVVLMRQEITGVHDPHDPDYDWDHHGDDMVVFEPSGTVYAVPREANFYRCLQCDVPLQDEQGREFWEPGALYKWLKGLIV